MSLLKQLNARFSGGPYYVRLRRDRLSVNDVGGDGLFDEEPLIVISHDHPHKIESVGTTARKSGKPSMNPFLHPRIIVSDFFAAEELLRRAFRIVSGRKAILPAPVAVMHWVEELEGGLSQIEMRVSRELAEGAGARRVYIWEGRELSDEELRSGAYQTAI